MSLFRISDFAHQTKETKNRERIQKTKLPTSFKTKKHKCSQCGRDDAELIKISAKETRWLCPIHIIKWNNKGKIEKPHFLRASKIV